MSKAKQAAQTVARDWLQGDVTEGQAVSILASILGISLIFAEKLLIDAADKLTQPGG